MDAPVNGFLDGKYPMPCDDAEDSKIWRKLARKEERYEREQRFLRKRSEDYEVLEEVFDKSTLMVIYKLLNEGVIKELMGIVSAGKEARVYSGVGPNNEPIAIKIYLTITAEFRRGRLKYLIGDPRFSVTSKDLRKLINLWASKEFKNLKTAHGAGISVPRPIAWRRNVVVMEFIGRDFTPAPLLKDVEDVDYETYEAVLDEVRKLYREAKLVHADLSEYNIFLHNGRIVLFDLAQSVHVDHPMAESFLIRDISSLNAFFRKRGVEVLSLEETLEFIRG